MGVMNFVYDNCPDIVFLKMINLHRFLCHNKLVEYKRVSKNHWVMHYGDYDLHAPGPRWIDKSLVDFRNKFNSVYPINQGDVCVDVGACIGDTTLPMLIQSGDPKNVFAVEPMVFNQNFLRINLPNIKLLPFAVSTKDGNEYMYTHESAVTGHSLDVDFVGLNHSNDNIVVKCVSLDTLISYTGFIDFCKIDIQGMEAKVLAHGNRFFDNVDRMVVETHNVPYITYLDCLKILSEKGFETFFNPFTEIIHCKKEGMRS